MPKKYDVKKYLRKNRMPHIWCAGCGNGTVTSSFLRAVDDLRLDQDRVVVVSGIGCSARVSGYLDFNTLHTTHGRAIAFATGIKLAKPSLEVVVMTGDGDTSAIGGNHFLHACRRNVNITLIVYNNRIYGMTGGQHSPLTPLNDRSPSTPYGNLENPLDICQVAVSAGATYVARGATYYPVQLEELIRKGIQNRGFSLIEAITQCPVQYGRWSRLGDGIAMLKWQKENTITVEAAGKLPPEAVKKKILRGELALQNRPEFIQEYERMICRLREEELSHG